jgi:hypothetical protein
VVKIFKTIGGTVKTDGSMKNSRWVRLLAYVTGSVNQELLLRNEYLAAENRILRTKLPARLRLCDPERVTLAEIGKAAWPQSAPGCRADRTRRDAGDLGLSSSLPLCAARSRHEVLCVVSVSASKRWRQDDSTTGPKPEPECVRGAVGSLSKTGVPVQIDSVR